MRRLMMLTAAGLLPSIALSACSGLVQHSIAGSKRGGYLAIQADAEGWRAMNDGNTGIIAETRTPADKKSSYYQLRELQQNKQTEADIFTFGGGNGAE